MAEAEARKLALELEKCSARLRAAEEEYLLSHEQNIFTGWRDYLFAAPQLRASHEDARTYRYFSALTRPPGAAAPAVLGAAPAAPATAPPARPSGKLAVPPAQVHTSFPSLPHKLRGQSCHTIVYQLLNDITGIKRLALSSPRTTMLGSPRTS